MATRDNYQLTELDLTQLNFLLQRIADRIDKLEGIRGKPDLETKGVTVEDDNDAKIHSFE